MNKFLLSCFIAFGIGANAQITVNENFEGTLPSTWAGSGGYTPASYSGIYTNAGCTGTDNAYGVLLFTTTAASKTATLTYTKPAAITANGKQIDIKFDYQIDDALTNGSTGALTGNIIISYSTAATGTTFTTLSTIPYNGATASCQNITATIPDGLITGDFRLRITTTSTSANNSNGNYVFLDNISIIQQVTAVPSCTTLSSPANAATNVPVRSTLSWPNVANAQAYILKIGTAAGASDVLSTTLTTNSYTPTAATAFPQNTLLYVSVTPTNSLGSATGCTETTFTTGANTFSPYCGPLVSTAPTQTAPIKSVTFNGITNTSDNAATTIGTFSPHESFVNTVFAVNNNVTTIPFTIEGIALANNGWASTIYIDWNNDGDFDDAGESYFNTTETMNRTTTVSSSNIATFTGNITVPSGVSVGQKRMRIKYNFCGTVIHNALSTPCSDVGNGQAEDYTIDYRQYLAVNDINKAGISVYPNPFTDVLNISDVKGVKSVSVNDISGREVKSLAPAAELNLSSLKTGLYIVNLKMEDGSVKTFKAIKK